MQIFYFVGNHRTKFNKQMFEKSVDIAKNIVYTEIVKR